MQQPDLLFEKSTVFLKEFINRNWTGRGEERRANSNIAFDLSDFLRLEYTGNKLADINSWMLTYCTGAVIYIIVRVEVEAEEHQVVEFTVSG